MKIKSLSVRLLVAEGVVLAAFFAIVAVLLEQGFRDSAEQSLQERLQIQTYALMSAASFTHAGNLTLSKLYEPRFTPPASGLYGFIQHNEKLVWRSPSAIGLDVMMPPLLKPDTTVFMRDSHERYVLHRAVVLQQAGVYQQFVFTVAEDAHFVSSQVAILQKTLRFSLALIGVVLVSIQFALLGWSLKPLRIIVKDLKAIEQGEKTHLDGHYPTELAGLAGHLNAFIAIERVHLERYRNNLADLAHSLKTPLAILRGCVESFNDSKATVQEQITRMNDIVDYQLQRAAAKGEQKTIKTTDLSEIITKINASLTKVYLDKAIIFDVDIPPLCQVYYEQGDLYEIVGNLLDNACKWCHSTVKVSIVLNQRKARRDFAVLLTIEDDGLGIPVGKFNDILKRGVRADENIHGHGIGMTVVFDLIALLGGKLEGGKSAALGGMRWCVYLP